MSDYSIPMPLCLGGGGALSDQVQGETDVALESRTQETPSLQECARHAETLILSDRKRKGKVAVKWSEETKAKARATRDARQAKLDDYPRLVAQLDAMTQKHQCLMQQYNELKGCALGATVETVDQMLSRHQQNVTLPEVDVIWISQAPNTES